MTARLILLCCVNWLFNLPIAFYFSYNNLFVQELSLLWIYSWGFVTNVFWKSELDIPLLSNGEITCEALCSIWSSPVQQRRYYSKVSRNQPQQWLGELEHLFCEERLREFELLILEKRWRRGTLPMYSNTWRETAKKIEPSSFQWCPPTGQEVIQTEIQDLPSEHEKILFIWRWLSHWHSCS